MLDPLPILPCHGPIRGTIRPPGSKSITNRALVCAALARGRSRITGGLDSEDTRVMVGGLTALGIGVDPDWERGEFTVAGCGGAIPARQAILPLRTTRHVSRV